MLNNKYHIIMRLKHFLTGIIASLLLGACVGEDIITDESLLVLNLRFDRKLESVAIDENTQINSRLVIGNTPVDLSSTDQFSVSYSSDKPDVLEIDSKGIVTPNPSSLEEIAEITVTIKENNVENPRTAEIKDDIQVGVVTISENEAKGKSEAELKKLISQGYDPKITITNLVKTISVDNTNGIKLSAVFQNRKNNVEEVIFGWSSSDTNILTVSNEGQILPVAKGNSKIKVATTFESEEVSQEIDIEVAEEDVVEEVEVDPGGGNLGSGSLQSNSSYTIKGSFEIVNEGGQNILKLGNDFDARSTPMIPDLVIYLSNSTTSNAGAPALAEIANVEPNLPQFVINGEQSIVIPANVDPANFSNVLLYCRDFGVRVGFGTINR